MTLPLTPDVLRAAYNYLNETQPFVRWNLPDGDDVVFKVVRDRNRCGWYLFDNGRHIIGVSTISIGRSSSLIELMAHEMVHLHERLVGTGARGTLHGASFYRYAAQVCRVHGFDPKLFQ